MWVLTHTHKQTHRHTNTKILGRTLINMHSLALRVDHYNYTLNANARAHTSRKPLAATPAVSHEPFKSSDYGPCQPGRIPGMSEGLTTSKSLSESYQLFQTGLSVTLSHTDIHTDQAPKANREIRGREYGNTQTNNIF